MVDTFLTCVKGESFDKAKVPDILRERTRYPIITDYTTVSLRHILSFVFANTTARVLCMRKQKLTRNIFARISQPPIFFFLLPPETRESWVSAFRNAHNFFPI